MGLLFHGLPGCGKTSTIKAIANHTQRHIVSVPLNRIKTSKHLLEIFYQEQLNHMNVPLSKRLYVIEDIDCSELKDIVRERSSSEDQDSGVSREGGGGISNEDWKKHCVEELLKTPQHSGTVEAIANRNFASERAGEGRVES